MSNAMTTTMTTTETTSSPASAPLEHENIFHKEVYSHIAQYAHAQDRRAWFELFFTLIIFASLWIFPPTYMLKYLFVLTGLVRIRLFIIFHDMGHLSFFDDPTLNKVVGTSLSTLIYTPYSYWTKGHNYHHKHSNNLDKMQYAQTCPWTKQQFQKAPFWQKVIYAIIYGPLTLWTFIPVIYFLILQRPVSKWIENLLSIFFFLFTAYLGREYFIYEICTITISATCGFFLFHVQHTFQGCYKKRSQNWNYFDNGMKGSSFFEVPFLFKWFTFGIEYHHIHHLNSRVPGYRLKECHDTSGHLFDEVQRVTIWQAFKSLPYSLYDEYRGDFENVYNEFVPLQKTAETIKKD